MEVNVIERLRDYEWMEMHLSLCLECSKLYEGWRDSEKGYYYSDFIKNLEHIDIVTGIAEPIEVAIAGRHIHFTATHLAEVQAILERHRNLKKQPQED